MSRKVLEPFVRDTVTKPDHGARVGRLQAIMSRQAIDVVLLSVGADLPYFTAYEAMQSERLTVLVIRAEGVPVMFVPELEAPRVTQGEFEVRSWHETEDPIALASAAGGSPSSVAVGDHMWSSHLVAFQQSWPRASWVRASELSADLRMVKDPGEIQLLRNAAHAVDRVMARIPEEVSFGGRTEREVARRLSDLAVDEGHDTADFAIVASGPNGASPHHEPEDRAIEHGDLVVCDFGGRLGGYYSDSTRTFAVGEASEEQVEVHAVVLAANEAGRAAVRPGVLCEEIDSAARRVIDRAGYGERFLHRTGHGIGLEVHEHPYIVSGNDRPIEPGMAFSIEPGIYLPGRFGVRLEDIVVCDDRGLDSLNLAERRLVVVG